MVLIFMNKFVQINVYIVTKWLHAAIIKSS